MPHVRGCPSACCGCCSGCCGACSAFFRAISRRSSLTSSTCKTGVCGGWGVRGEVRGVGGFHGHRATVSSAAQQGQQGGFWRLFFKAVGRASAGWAGLWPGPEQLAKPEQVQPAPGQYGQAAHIPSWPAGSGRAKQRRQGF